MGYKPDDVLAGIYRDQWDDYVKRFFPLENELVDTYNNPAVHSRIIGAATQKVATGFDAAEGSYARGMARYGMSPDAQVKAEADRSFNLGRSLATVDAKNRTRQALLERDQGMLAGGMSTGGMVKETNK
jgi:hypothetical protein